MTIKIPKIIAYKTWRDQLSKVINTEKRVQVYRNLHKDCWSVRQSGKIVAHVDYLWLINARMNVGKIGRERVLQKRQKNVHAYISGYIDVLHSANHFEDRYEQQGYCWEEISYNPYKSGNFYCKQTEEPIMEAPMVDMCVHDDQSVMALTK